MASISGKESKEIVEKGYDAIAPAYLAWSSPRPTLTRATYLEKLLDQLQPGSSILELGCGAGVPSTQSVLTHPSKFFITGVDISSAQISLAQEHLGPLLPKDEASRLTLIHSDMATLSFPPQIKFSAVLAFYSLFHLPQDEYGPTIELISSWLKPGGVLLCNFRTDDGVIVHDDWMGAKMFSTGLGVERTRAVLKEYGKDLELVEDTVHTEIVGRFEEKFHWIWAVKKQD